MGGRREERRKEETKGWNEGRRKKKGRERGGEGGEEEGRRWRGWKPGRMGRERVQIKINFEKNVFVRGKVSSCCFSHLLEKTINSSDSNIL